jgi:uracil-DNA glycosylase family 4
VLGRGRIPADLLVIGEAPGPVENATGRPFDGPAGGVLDEILKRVARLWGGITEVELADCGPPEPSFFISNILACLPDDDRGGFREPAPYEAEACRPRVLELIELVRPVGLVLLGRIAKQFAPKTKIRRLCLVHPAWILRLEDLLEREYQQDRCAELIVEFWRKVSVHRRMHVKSVVTQINRQANFC